MRGATSLPVIAIGVAVLFARLEAFVPRIAGTAAALALGAITLVVGTKPVSLFDRSWFYAHGQDPRRQFGPGPSDERLHRPHQQGGEQPTVRAGDDPPAVGEDRLEAAGFVERPQGEVVGEIHGGGRGQ